MSNKKTIKMNNLEKVNKRYFITQKDMSITRPTKEEYENHMRTYWLDGKYQYNEKGERIAQVESYKYSFMKILDIKDDTLYIKNPVHTTLIANIENKDYYLIDENNKVIKYKPLLVSDGKDNFYQIKVSNPEEFKIGEYYYVYNGKKGK